MVFPLYLIKSPGTFRPIGSFVHCHMSPNLLTIADTAQANLRPTIKLGPPRSGVFILSNGWLAVLPIQ